MKKSFFKDFTKLTGKHLCWGLFFDEVASHYKTAVLQNTSGRLLLQCDDLYKTYVADYSL